MTKKLNDALRKQKKNTKEKPLLITGSLGIPLGGQVLVEVPNRNAFVYVKLRDNHSEVIQAFNNKVAPVYNLPVIVERVNNRYEVIGVDAARYQSNWSSFAPYLPRHGNTHSFNIEGGGGGDIVWVYPRQFMPSLILPSGSSGGPNVVMTSYILKNADGTWKYTGLTGTSDITVHKPTGTSAVMVLVYLDSQSGNPYFLVGSGSYFSESITGSSEVYQYIPSSPNTSHIPLAAVRLVSGTNIISWDNIYDVRQFIHTTPTGTGGSNIAIQDEGVAKGSVTTLNFVGDNVQATVSGNTARIFVTGSAGGGSINTGTLDARYLKLDASNDPLTGELDITSPTYGASITSSDGYSPLYLNQDANGISTDPVIYAERYSTGSSGQFTEAAYHIRDDIKSAQFKGGSLRHIFYSGSVPYRPQTIAEINPYAHATTGTPFYINAQNPISATGTFLLFERQGTEIFRVNGSGTALSNGVPLIKEAPADGQPYGRQNNGWVVLLTGTVGGGGGSVTGLGVMTRDSGVPLGTGTILDFGNNLYASISGSVVDINTLPSWFDVKHYGASGNGTTDDTAAVNRAISALNSSGSGVLYFPAGTYKCSSALTSITGSCTVLGDGNAGLDSGGLTSSATLITCTSQTASLFTIIGETCTFQGLTLQNTFAGTPSAGAGITVSGGTVGQQVDYNNVTVHGFYINIDVQVGAQWVMHNCYLIAPVLYALKIRNTVNGDAGDWAISDTCFYADTYNSTAAIRMESSGGGKISNCKINKGTTGHRFDYGIDVSGSGNTSVLLISNNSIENIDINCIRTNGNWDYVIINGCQCSLYTSNNTNAISLTGLDYFNISDCTLIENAGTSVAAIALDSCTNGVISKIISRHFGSVVSQTSCSNIVLDSVHIQDEGIVQGYAEVLNFVGAGVTTTISGSVANISIAGAASTPPGISAIVVQNDGAYVASGTVLSFDNNLYTGLSGSVIHISSPVTTYQRFERPIPKASVTGTLWSVPDNVYASGSLGVFYNGLALYKNTDYEELIYVSGTYHLLFTPSTGSTHMVSYGVPCIPQPYSSTGTGGGAFDLLDSDSELLTDSDNVQLSDSDG